MSDRYTRITVPLSRAEFEALQTSAHGEYRHPREQARYILRQALLGSSQETQNRHDASNFAGTSITAVAA